MLNRENVTDALRFWELGRIPYNVLLLSVAALGFWFTQDQWQAWVSLLPTLAVLAVLANLAYCIVYPIDLLVQASDFRPYWRAYRWILWCVGAGFALMLAFVTVFGFSMLSDF